MNRRYGQLNAWAKARCFVVAGALVGAIPLAGCTSSAFETIAGYDVPPQTQPIPKGYPNVYTGIRRDDVLKSSAAKNATVRDLEEARDTHVQTTTEAIVGE